MNYNLAFPFYLSSLQHPQLLAVSTLERDLSYAELSELARKIAAWLGPYDKRAGHTGRVGIVGSRSILACAAVLGTCWTGRAYVSIGLKLPEMRLRSVLELCSLDAIIVDEQGEEILAQYDLPHLPEKILVAGAMPRGPGGREVSVLGELPLPVDGEPAWVDAGDTGYIVFTSGTTGTPKGVVIAAESVHHYVTMMKGRYDITPEDRVAETSDISFDISVNNMFLAWAAGASLHIIPSTQAMAPQKMIRDHRITLWYSVPSVIPFMLAAKGLSAGAFPALRATGFMGEPLTVTSAAEWQKAAPGSVIDNLYGPTEATVVCMAQRVENPPTLTRDRDVMAIGTPLPGTEVAIVDRALRFLPSGEEGQIALSGVQLARGYFAAKELTGERFPMIDGKRWYLTGDIGFQDEAGVFHCLGRMDNQVKVLGNRVELEDIEHHIRHICRSEFVAAVAWPLKQNSPSGLVAFIAGSDVPLADIKTFLKQRLPSYMVPNRIHVIDTMPMNANGKIDRKALIHFLNQARHELTPSDNASG